MIKFVHRDTKRECFILEIEKDLVLIYIPENNVTPFVIPAVYKIGWSHWYAGEYFSDIRGAVDYFNKILEGRK